MHFSQAIDAIARVTPEHFSSLADVIFPELIDECLEHDGVATLRKRRLPLDMVVWSIVGMALFRHIPMGKSLISSILSYPANVLLWHPAPLSKHGVEPSNVFSNRRRPWGTYNPLTLISVV